MGFAAVKSAVHGTIGGALSLAQGGNFLEGFASSAIGAAAGQISGAAFGSAPGIGGFALRTAVAAVAGGAAAAAAGGKFATGAITAAFAHMFNHETRRGGARSRLRTKSAVISAALNEGAKWLWLWIGDWTAISFRGTRVWINDSLICIECVNAKGDTSLELMKRGKAALGFDRKPINLHHILQTDPSALVEITTTQHRIYGAVLHNLYSAGRRTQINRSKFRTFRRRYWMWRATTFAQE